MRRSPTTMVAVLAVCSGGPAALAQPVTSAFTYQGELRNAGAPASGLHDLRFRLYDAASGGAQVGGTLCSDNVAVADGRFTVMLDFGAAFAGQQRFLEIEVRADTGLDCASAAGFVLLAPRQALSATPNAAFALNAATATSASSASLAINATQLNGQGASFYQNAANLSAGTIPDARLSGAYTGALTFSNAGNVFTGLGTGLTALNATNVASGTLGIARFPAGGSWALTSNLDIDDATLLIDPTNNRVGIGTASPSRTLDVRSGGLASVYGEVSNPIGDGVFGNATATTGTAWGVRGESASTSGIGVRGVAGASSGNTAGVHGVSFSPNGAGVRGVSEASTGYTIGVSGESSALNSTGTGVVGKAQATGGYFLAESETGTGLYGVASSPVGTTFGVQGHTASAQDGRGVFGWASASSGFSIGVLGQSDASDGIGVSGVANGSSTFAIGVKGTCPAGAGVSGSGRPGVSGTSTTGAGVYGSGVMGGHFVSATADGSAVRAEATATSGFNTTGVEARSDSFNGTGVSGWATSAAGGSTRGVQGVSDGISGIGVEGRARSSTGTNYGVYGQSFSASGWGLWAQGRSGASGTKSFRIDHPADPENKYLLHYSAESPEVINFYRGIVTLNGAGEAVVELPSYFARINRSPSYQLTAVGAPMPMLHVAVKISDEALLAGAVAEPDEAAPIVSFVIAGGAPGGEVSWRVEALRNDLWMRHRAAPVEADKEGRERGAYQHPEFYGLPRERAIGYESSREIAHPPGDREPARPGPPPASERPGP